MKTIKIIIQVILLSLTMLTVACGNNGGGGGDTPGIKDPAATLKSEKEMEKEFKEVLPISICRYQFFSEKSTRVKNGEIQETIIQIEMLRYGEVDGDLESGVYSTLSFHAGQNLRLKERDGYVAVLTEAGSISETSGELDFDPGKVLHGSNTELLPRDGSKKFGPGVIRLKFYKDQAEVSEIFGFGEVVRMQLYEYGCNSI